MSVHSAYYLRATGRMGGEMIVVVKCRGEEAGNMLLRRTRRSTHNNRQALVNVHDDAHRRAFKLKKVTVKLRWQIGKFKVFLSLAVCL